MGDSAEAKRPRPSKMEIAETKHTASHFAAMTRSALSDFALTLYHSPLTRASRVTWAIQELNLTNVEVRDVKIFRGEQYRPSFRTMSTMSAVPVLFMKHKTTGKELTMTESGAIVVFLCEQTESLLPRSDTFALAQFHRFCSLAISSMDPLVETIGMHARSSTAPVRGMRSPSTGDADFARMTFRKKIVPTLEEALGDEESWICAPYWAHFTAADVLVGYSLFWGSLYGLLDQSEILLRYLARIMDRPAFRAAVGTVSEIKLQLEKGGKVSGIDHDGWLLSKM